MTPEERLYQIIAEQKITKRDFETAVSVFQRIICISLQTAVVGMQIGIKPSKPLL